jgi:hypothetical protein
MRDATSMGRAEQENAHGGQEDALGPKPIGDPAARRRDHRQRQQVGGQRQLQMDGVGVKAARQGRQGGGESGGVDELHEQGRGDGDGRQLRQAAHDGCSLDRVIGGGRDARLDRRRGESAGSQFGSGLDRCLRTRTFRAILFILHRVSIAPGRLKVHGCRATSGLDLCCNAVD